MYVNNSTKHIHAQTRIHTPVYVCTTISFPMHITETYDELGMTFNQTQFQ